MRFFDLDKAQEMIAAATRCSPQMIATVRDVDAATAGLRAASFRTTGLTRTSLGMPIASGTGGSGVSLRLLRMARRIATHASNTASPPITAKSMTYGRFEWSLFISKVMVDSPGASFYLAHCGLASRYPHLWKGE